MKYRQLLVEDCPKLSKPKLSYKHLRSIMTTADSFINSILPTFLFLDLNTITALAVAVGALVLQYKTDKSPGNQKKRAKAPSSIPSWERLDHRIGRLQVHLSWAVTLCQEMEKPKSQRLLSKIHWLSNILRMKYSVTFSHLPSLRALIEHLCQRNAVLRSHLQRYKNHWEWFRQNYIFQNQMRLFYRSSRSKRHTVVDPPGKDELETFWRKIWSPGSKAQTNSSWFLDLQCDSDNTAGDLNLPDISEIDIQCALRSTPNWKTPGCDGLHVFWIKHLPSLHSHLANILNAF